MPSRVEIEALIESLIDYLDRQDGDADLEDGGDAEPMFAARIGPDSQTRWAGFAGGLVA